jgi:hypothetical protein
LLTKSTKLNGQVVGTFEDSSGYVVK